MISPSRTTSTYGSGLLHQRRFLKPKAECAAESRVSLHAVRRT